MRTTLTLNDDLAEELQRRARETGRSFKDVVNETIRRGLHAAEEPVSDEDRFVVVARSCGFRPGIDPEKLNQLLDELETEDFSSATEVMKVADS